MTMGGGGGGMGMRRRVMESSRRRLGGGGGMSSSNSKGGGEGGGGGWTKGLGDENIDLIDINGGGDEKTDGDIVFDPDDAEKDGRGGGGGCETK